MSKLLVQATPAPSFEGDTHYGEASDTDHDAEFDRHYQTFERDEYGDIDNSASNRDINVNPEEDGEQDNNLYLLSHCGDLNLLTSVSWRVDDDLVDPATNACDEALKMAEAALFAEAKIGGFALARRSSVRDDRHETVGFCHVEYECAQGQAKTERSRHCINCPYKVSLNFSWKNKNWTLHVKDSTHNHRRSDVSRFAVFRRWDRKKFCLLFTTQVMLYMTMSNLTAAQAALNVMDEVRFYGLNIQVYAQDIRNGALQVKAADRGALTDTQMLIRKLDGDSDVIYRARYENEDGTGRLLTLVWTNTWAVQQWKKNFEVIIMDNTYKTNRFNRPLMQVAGVMSGHESFNIGWAVMVEETEGEFSCVFGMSKRMSHIIPKRKWNGSLDGTVIGQTVGGVGSQTRDEGSHITEEDRAARSAVVVPRLRRPAELSGMEETRLTHVAAALLAGPDRRARSVRERAVQMDRGEEGREQRAVEGNADDFLLAWEACAYAETEVMFNDRWNRLITQYETL
ncbi:Transcription factor AFT [Ascosphaera apis ARSEF 7405]|uniref:Transcription factor AFT n=1 Tax=Ascosphaera apis ARSEF 7405 TaxID=392613 RepID=A0A166NRN8_9EURO|nr:Transcription factor AFT [Ascosphaera apis ARSEF 7405]